MKITFMTTLGRNIGDEFIRAGIQAVLKVCNIEYTPLYVCKHDLNTLFRFVEDETCKVEDKFWNTDVFIQAGAPVYWKLPDGNTSLTSTWHKELWEERILKPAGPKFLNIGAGSCFSWNDVGSLFMADEPCRKFALDAVARATLTTVRDPVAASIVENVSEVCHAIACPAFLAAWDHPNIVRQKGLIGVNFMPLGCHHDLNGDFDKAEWAKWIPSLLLELRKKGRLVFIAHTADEAVFMKQFNQAGERVFYAHGWRNYLPVYGACKQVVANRVHGAVVAAGFGAKAAIIGNDTRAQIGRYVGIPYFRADACMVDEIMYRIDNIDTEALAVNRYKVMNKYADLFTSVLKQ